MATAPCEGCGTPVKIAGGLENLWRFEGEVTGGMTLEFADGTDHFLCFDCIERLPNDPTARDVQTGRGAGGEG